AYFIPVITPMIVAAIVWSWVFDPNNGIMNFALIQFGITTPPKWLYDKNYEKANDFWGKMIDLPNIKNAEYPVGVQKISDTQGWWIFDIIYQSKKR
ncbi:MAG: hypothetical protein ACXVA2_25165, partial [Mucilaginibacter sp.]